MRRQSERKKRGQKDFEFKICRKYTQEANTRDYTKKQMTHNKKKKFKNIQKNTDDNKLNGKKEIKFVTKNKTKRRKITQK